MQIENFSLLTIIIFSFVIQSIMKIKNKIKELANYYNKFSFPIDYYYNKRLNNFNRDF